MMSVGTCSLTVSLSGHTLVGTPTGDAGSLALFLVTIRGARLLTTLNATLASSIAGATGTALANILAGVLAAAQSHAQDLANQCEDDAQLVSYFQENAAATLPAKSVDGTSLPAKALELQIG